MIHRLLAATLIALGIWLLSLYATVEESRPASTLSETQITDLTGGMVPIMVTLLPRDDRLRIQLRSLITYPAQKPLPQADVRVTVRASDELIYDDILSMQPSEPINTSNPLLEFDARATSQFINITRRDTYALVVERIAGGDFPILSATATLSTWPRPVAVPFYLQWGAALLIIGAISYLISPRKKSEAKPQAKKEIRKWGRGK